MSRPKRKREKRNWQDCPGCLKHFTTNPMMAEALASVGIEHGMSSGEMAEEFYAVYHQRGHREG